VLPVPHADQGRHRVGQREQQHRDHEQHPVAAREEEDDRDADGEVQLAEAGASHAVDHVREGSSGPPEDLAGEEQEHEDRRKHQHRPRPREEPGEGEDDEAHPDVQQLSGHLRTDPPAAAEKGEQADQERERSQGCEDAEQFAHEEAHASTSSTTKSL
jgi:hypothetical protein